MKAPLAPALGRLAAPARRGAYDAVRLAMLDRLIDAHTSGALTGATWMRIWSQAMAEVRDAVLTDAEAGLTVAGLESRYPASRLRALRPDQESSDVLLQRLLAQGLDLERLEHSDDRDAAVHRGRGAALEAAWTAALRVAEGDTGRWRGVANEVAMWRRPYRSLVLGAVPILALALLCACWIGGIVSSPAWFAPVTAAFWSLPWP